jgi:putative ubiquitin-RnfH superfamily antitoxin RatB of RatAB toxin-antitoxin module
MAEPQIDIWAVEAFVDHVVECRVYLDPGSTLKQALERLYELQFEPLMLRLESISVLQLPPGSYGVNGKRAKLGQILFAQDRIEFYRPMLIEPKTARQAKVLQQRQADLIAKEQNKQQINQQKMAAKAARAKVHDT